MTEVISEVFLLEAEDQLNNRDWAGRGFEPPTLGPELQKSRIQMLHLVSLRNWKALTFVDACQPRELSSDSRVAQTATSSPWVRGFGARLAFLGSSYRTSPGAPCLYCRHSAFLNSGCEESGLDSGRLHCGPEWLSDLKAELRTL